MWKETIAKVVAWVASPGEPSHPINLPPYVDNSLPGDQPYPDRGLPGDQPYPDHGLPGSQPHPEHPIVIGPGKPAHPIYFPPGHPEHPIYIPGFPSHPIVYPPPVVPTDKPRGLPVIDPDPMFKPPMTGPSYPGVWVTVNAGPTEPPAYGWLQAQSSLPMPKGGGAVSGGHWVAVDNGTPKRPDGVYPPTWVWIPEIGPNFGTFGAQPK